MIIGINRGGLHLLDRYRTHIEGSLKHKAVSRLYKWGTAIDLKVVPGDSIAYTIKRRWSFFRFLYKIIHPDGMVTEFIIKNGRSYCCAGSDLYELYIHRGCNVSIFKNAEQIAWWRHNRSVWMADDLYRIFADRDVDAALLMCFCIIFDWRERPFSNGNPFAVDFGHIGSELRPFNEDWVPD